jgi:hypothetical protein
MTIVEDFGPRRPGVRPLAALESHVALVQALRKPGPDGGARLWNAMEVDKDLVVQAQGTTRAEAVAKLYGEALNRGATIVVTNRMLDVVLDRMAGIKIGQELRPEDLPFAAGMVVLPRAVRVPNDDAEVAATFDPGEIMLDQHRPEYAAFDAVSWVPSQVMRVEDKEGRDLRKALGLPENMSGIMYANHVSKQLGLYITKVEKPDGITAEIIEEAYGHHRVDSLPIYSAGWAFDLSWDPEYREGSFVLTAAGEFERRFYLALWRTLKEEVVAPVHFRRGDMRRAARLRAHVPEVVVCDLRKIKHRHQEEPTEDGAVIMWSHRWRVREHTRTYHRGTPDERTITIESYIKGPENMPLLEKDVVYRLSR